MKQYKINYKLLLLAPATLIVMIVLALVFHWHLYRTATVSRQLNNNPSTNTRGFDSTQIAPPMALASSATPISAAIKPVPILMYHYIRDLSDPLDKIGTDLSVSPAIFDQQMNLLHDRGYQSISFDQYLSLNMPAKPVIITFDDGYDDAYTQAFPVLIKYNYIGIFYIISGKLNTPGYLTGNQIKDMVAARMIIGDHTISHLDLTTLTLSRLTKEVTDSKSQLENLTGQIVTDFCYPSGKYNNAVIGAVKAAGYTTATTTKSPSLVGFQNYFELQRLRIHPTDTPSSVLARVSSVK